MKGRLTNLLFVVVAALAIGGGAYLLSTSMPSTQASAPEGPASAGGNNPGSEDSEPEDGPTDGRGGDARNAPTPAAYDSERLSEGAEVYAAHCQACHGGSGAGNGPWAEVGMETAPRDFTDQEWMSSQSDGVFYTSIQRGVPGTAMPSFEDRLTEDEIWSAVAYIRGFAPKVTLDDSSRSGEENAEGKELYAAKCAGCHGVDGEGDGAAAEAFGTQPRQLNNAEWLNSKSDDELLNTITEGLPSTAMPAFRDELTTGESESVVSYLRELADHELQPNPQQGGWAERNYRAYCASCHGIDGDGSGPAAGRLDPEPRDFRNPQWMAGQSDGHLTDVIGEGRPGTAMPPFQALLTKDERASLAKYIKDFSSPEAMPGAGSAQRYSPPSGRGNTPGSSRTPAADR